MSTNDKGNFVEKATVIKEGAGSTYNVDKDSFEDIDLTQFSDEELSALGIDPSEVEREEETLEDDIEDEEDEDLEDDIEEEDDDDDDEEYEDEEDDEDSEEDEEDDIRIPKARFDEAVSKERRKTEELAERTKFLEGQIEKLLELQVSNAKTPTAAIDKAVESEVDIDALEMKYMDEILSGEVDNALKIRKQINAAQQATFNNLLKLTREEAKKDALELSEAEKLEAIKEEAMEVYPFLDDNDEDFDEDLVSEINSFAIGLAQNKKISMSQALEKAVNKLALPYARDLYKDYEVKTTKKTSTRRAEKASKVAKEPQKIRGGKMKDLTPEEIDWEAMSEKEFDNLYKTNRKLVDNYLKGVH